MAANLARLAALAAMIQDRELGKLQQAQLKRISIENSLLELRRAKTNITQIEDFDTARLAGRDQVWTDWADQKIAALNVGLAKAAAEAETQKKATRLAFGRASVLKNLSERKSD